MGLTKEEIRLQTELKAQNMQINSVQAAEKTFESDGNIDALIEFWENIWSNGGLLFNGSKWTFRLPDLYIKQKRYDDALRILKKIRNPYYIDKKNSYIERIEKLKQRANNKKK